METTSTAMIAAIERIYHILPAGTWPVSVYEFLKRPAAREFMTEYMAETGKPLDETVLIMLAAIRYMDLGDSLDPGTASILEQPGALTNLDLFLVRHHSELFHLCRTRHVQANLFERAFPVMELLGKQFGNQKLVVIELGCSFGMIGRALCAAPQVMERFEDLCDPSQQKPAAWPLGSIYRGVDLAIPDAKWLLACLSRRASRQRTARFLQDIPVSSECRVRSGSALEFTEMPDIATLIPRFSAEHPDHLVPVVLTSFMLYQFPADLRERLCGMVAEFVRLNGGTWINLDLVPQGESYHFFVAQDGVERMVLENDSCAAWRWC